MHPTIKQLPFGTDSGI